MTGLHSLTESRLQLALDAGAMGTWTSDLRTGSQIWNERQFEITGLSGTTSPTREVFLSLVLPEDRHIVEWTGRQLSPGARHESEFRIRRPDGAIRWLASSAMVRTDEAGSPIELVGINWDITDQKRSELELVEAERRLSLATAAAQIGIWDWDLDTGAFFYSSRAREIYGFSQDEPISFEMLRERTHGEDYGEVERLLSRALNPAERAVATYRYRITKADTREERWLLAHGGALFSDSGSTAKALRYTGTLQDISEEVRLEENLRAERASLQLALEAGDLALWELVPATGEVTHSATLNRLYGFPDEARPTYQEFAARYAPGENERLEQTVTEALSRGETSLRLEARILRPDNVTKWVAVRAQVFLDGTVPTRVIGVAMDITDRRHWEETLLVTAAELQHRVKNTLAIVQGIAVQTFRSNANYEDAIRNFHGRLRALGTATELITRNNWVNVSLRDLAVETLAPFNTEERIHLFGNHVAIDSRHANNLAMALHELCTNAVKYGALSNETGRVDLSWEQTNGIVALHWSESGGPPVTPPAREGFGSKLLRSGTFASGGSAQISFEPGGVEAKLLIRSEGPAV